jgi:hypothetical protein
MEGSKPLPEGSSMKEQIEAVHNNLVKLLQEREMPWRTVYSSVWNELVGYEQGLRQAKKDQGVN